MQAETIKDMQRLIATTSIPNSARTGFEVAVCCRSANVLKTDSNDTNEALTKNIIAAVCSVCLVPDLGVMTKAHYVSRPRFIAMYMIRNTTEYTWKKIGQIMRPRKPFNHSTVMNAYAQVKDLLDVRDEEMVRIYNKVVDMLDRGGIKMAKIK